MELNAALKMIAKQTGLDADELIAYAAEDTIGGYHWRRSDAKFQAGSIWGVEGQVLYALVRAMKPNFVVEIGGWVGCSTTHLAAAIKANGRGTVYSVDNQSEGAYNWKDFSQDLRKFVELVHANGEDWLAEQEDHSIDLLFDDASHAFTLVKTIGELAQKKVSYDGVLVTHDAGHDFAYLGNGQATPSPLGDRIRSALAEAKLSYVPYLIDPSDCGLAISTFRHLIPFGEPMNQSDIAPIEAEPVKPAAKAKPARVKPTTRNRKTK